MDPLGIEPFYSNVQIPPPICTKFKIYESSIISKLQYVYNVRSKIIWNFLKF